MNSNRRQFLQTAGTLTAATFLLPATRGFGAQPRPIRKALMYGTLSYKGTVLEKFQALKDAGFEGVEPNSHMNQEEVVAALEATGLEAASVCGNLHWAKPLSDPNPAVREAGLEGLKQTLRDAKRYKATSILLVPGVVKDSVTYQQCFDRSVAEIKKALPVAEELGVKIAIENVWNNFITKPEQAVEYLDAIGSPMVGWHLDLGNVIRFSPAEEWVPVLGKRILKLHVKEYSKAKGFGVRFFEGDNHWPAIMAALDKIGYRGWGISEQPGAQAANAEELKDLSARMTRVFAS